MFLLEAGSEFGPLPQKKSGITGRRKKMIAMMRQFWTLMALLTMMALISFTVQAILETETDEGTPEPESSQTPTPDAPQKAAGRSDVSSLMTKAVDWVMAG